ncbi:DUF262 domain-containing protein [Chitinophaga ginsengisegetis]|uniref:DUF262 domain-containing protein n=1 Tax=Chitinophaga ginsengisegetis TaxID=393003 RepID=UPI000DBAA743|nr:DUF262 domain-containing protein [Chitinophaga ginsengisegetis]MDR6571253.1 hypothetical protein [Chitinophaga ginsengisegetis]MDR6650909.1 hypothetical protein [Chitinophaga ginsengisegetis]MDR6657337.1 hypothetical protein [Chitinophaga ginsengisegetis]
MDYRTTIGNIFSPRKNCFAVPTYQRAYSWDVGSDKDKQVPQFLKDLQEHPVNVAQYHLGHFLFEQDKGDKNKYWVIDGQQRMTTVIIFLSCIYKRLKEISQYSKEAENIYAEYLKNTDDKQKFETVEYDNNFFFNVIIEEREDKIDTRSRRRIKEAQDYLNDKITQTDVSEILHWKALIENAKITTDTIEGKAESTQIFTFQNDRGKDLTNLEKLKAFLMLQIFLACKNTESDPDHAIGFVEKEFEAIYKALEKIDIADEDQVFNYHTTAFLSHADTALERVKNGLLRTPIPEQQKWIRTFVVALKRSFEYVVTIQEKRKVYSSIADVLFLDQSNSFPLLIKLYHYHENSSEFESVVRLMEIILFRLKYTTGNYYSNYLPRLAYDYSGTDLPNLKKLLLHHAKFGFKDYWNFEGDFHNYLNGDNHYFGLTRYLLWKYENHLREEIKEPHMLFPEFSNLYGKPKFENTIDHWTPQNPYDKEYEKEFTEKYLHNIGNMVLSTRGRNASDSNSLPDDRSTVSILISRQKLEPFKGNWNKEDIKRRQREIVEFARHHWNPANIT